MEVKNYPILDKLKKIEQDTAKEMYDLLLKRRHEYLEEHLNSRYHYDKSCKKQAKKDYHLMRKKFNREVRDRLCWKIALDIHTEYVRFEHSDESLERLLNKGK